MRVGQPRGRLGAQVHHEQVGIAAALQAEDHALAVGREAWAEAHAGKIADDLALPGLDVHQIDLGIALAIRHVSDGVGRGGEARREHEILAAREVAHVGAVLVHEREALDAPLTGPGFVDEYDAAVEVAFLAGQPFIDRIRNDMRDAPPVVGGGVVLLAVQLLAGEHVPQPELGLEPTLALGDAAGDERLRVDLPPVRKARQVIDGVDLLDVSGGIDGREEARALQIRRDDAADVAPQGRIPGRDPDEFRDRDRDRLHVALGDVELKHSVGGP